MPLLVQLESQDCIPRLPWVEAVLSQWPGTEVILSEHFAALSAVQKFYDVVLYSSLPFILDSCFR